MRIIWRLAPLPLPTLALWKDAWLCTIERMMWFVRRQTLMLVFICYCTSTDAIVIFIQENVIQPKVYLNYSLRILRRSYKLILLNSCRSTIMAHGLPPYTLLISSPLPGKNLKYNFPWWRILQLCTNSIAPFRIILCLYTCVNSCSRN